MEWNMRKELIGAASALALVAGAAFAADNSASPGSSSSQLDRPAASQSQSSTTTTTTSKSSMPSRASAEELLGKTVVGANDEKIGEVKDIILDGKNGAAKQLVVASGGFLGIGEKNIAIDYKAAHWQADKDRVSVPSLSRQQVQAMNEFNYDDSMVSLNRSTDMDRSSTSSSHPANRATAPAAPARPLPSNP
jgi:sporulation protein YlmC with PRC-barrel domain